MIDGDNSLYFAYGSNLHAPRLRARVPSAAFVDVARLPGYCLAFRKRGADGSGKCDLEPLEMETVWGVLYRIDPAEVGALDAVEGDGYRRENLSVCGSGGLVDAFTYRARADWFTDALPFDWYRDLVVAGARAHGLPAHYANAIARMDASADPDAARAAANRP